MNNKSSKNLNSIDENQSTTGARPTSRGIYVLPNLLTSAGLFAGFYAIMQSRLGHYEAACLAIYVAMIMDILDGRLARLTNTMTKFGSEFDSLADMVSFGVAPALVMYEFALVGTGKVGSFVTFVFIACAALRLARFNVTAVSDKKYFLGLPSPGAAGLIASLVWVLVEYEINVGTASSYMIATLMVVTAIAMVSNAPYRSFKDVDLKNKMPFVGMIALVLVIAVIYLDPPSAFLLIGASYTFSGLLIYVVRKLNKSRQGDVQ